MKVSRCIDAGIKCHWSTSASNVDHLMNLIKEHTGRNHTLNEIPPDIYYRVRSVIKNDDHHTYKSSNKISSFLSMAGIYMNMFYRDCIKINAYVYKAFSILLSFDNASSK